jgi:deoxyribonuclease NucA/NucB
MATRTRSSLLLPILAVVGIVAVVGIGPVKDLVSDVFGGITGYDTVVLGEGAATIMVASNAESDLETCTVEQITSAKQCDNLKILVIDAAKMPFIARNIQLAWGEGKDFMLHRDAPESRRSKYDEVCGAKSAFVIKHPGQGSCDEYAFASTSEGGAGARTEEVPVREQNCQGATVKNAYYSTPGIAVGEEFLVVISNPASIAGEPFAGVDTAKEQACGL